MGESPTEGFRFTATCLPSSRDVTNRKAERLRLVESEVEHVTDPGVEAAPLPKGVLLPPRPERRRVYVSLFVTLATLVATVVTIYTVFPKRSGELLDVALETYAKPTIASSASNPADDAADAVELELERPNDAELRAWSKGLLGGDVSWPSWSGGEATVVGAHSLTVLRRKVAVVRLSIDGEDVCLLATRARDAPPRTRRRQRDDSYAVSYRRGRWTLVAVGPYESRVSWLPKVGAPKSKS